MEYELQVHKAIFFILLILCQERQRLTKEISADATVNFIFNWHLLRVDLD